MSERVIKQGKRRIELASTDRLNKLGDLPYEVVRLVSGTERCLLTDESSLWDFWHSEGDREAYKKAALEWVDQAYGVDVSSIEDLNIVRICERIKGVDDTWDRLLS